MFLNVLIVLALLATVAALGMGLLAMAMGGATDDDFGERFMWGRIIMQAAAAVLIIVTLYFANAS